MALKIVKYSSNIPNESGFALKNIESMLFLINFISSNTDIDYRNKQELLEIDILKERATKLLELLGKQVKILELKEDIQKKVKVDMDKQQREYLLHQQIKPIQNERGGSRASRIGRSSQKEKVGKERAGNFRKRTSKIKTPKSFHPGLFRAIQLRERIDRVTLGTLFRGQFRLEESLRDTGCRSLRTG